MTRITTSPRLRSLFILAVCGALAVGIVQACSGDSNSPDGSIVLTPTPATLSVARGASGTVTVAIARTGYTDGVTLAAENLPTGVTQAFVPNGTTGNSSTLTLTASAVATLGTSTVTIRGSGDDINDATTTISLTVAAATASITLAPVPIALSIAQGSSTGNVTVNLARTNFTGAVTLAGENLPTGVTVAFVPQGTTGGVSTMTFTATAGAALGTTNITIRGSGTGITSATNTLALTVTPANASVVLTPASGTLQVSRNSNNVVSINIARTNFAGAVTLSAENLPAGVTAAFVPQGTVGTVSSLTFTAGAAATLGTSNVTVRATGAGIADATTVVALTVNAEEDGSLSVTATRISESRVYGITGPLNR